MKVWIAWDYENSECLGIFQNKADALDAVYDRVEEWYSLDRYHDPDDYLRDWLNDAENNEFDGIKYWEEEVR